MESLPLRPKLNSTQSSHTHTSNSRTTSSSPPKQPTRRAKRAAKKRANSISKSKSKSKTAPRENRARLPTLHLVGFFVNRDFLEHKHLKCTYSFAETITHPPGCECELDECDGHLASWDFDTLAEQARSETLNHDKERASEAAWDRLRAAPAGPVPRLPEPFRVDPPWHRASSAAQALDDPFLYLESLPQVPFQRFPLVSSPEATLASLPQPPAPFSRHDEAPTALEADTLERPPLDSVIRRFRDRNNSLTGNRSPSSPLSRHMTLPPRPSAPAPERMVRENRRGQVPSSQQARDSTHGALVESMAEMRDSLRRRLERMGTELDAVRASLGGGGLRTQRTRTESTRGSSSIDVVRGVGDRSSGQIYQDFTEQMASSSRATGQSGEPSVSQREHDA